MTFKHDVMILVLVIAKYRLQQELFQVNMILCKAVYFLAVFFSLLAKF